MRSGLITAALVLAMTAPASAKVFPFPYQVHTLQNGLKVYLIPMPSPGLVAYYSVVRTGSRDEVEAGHSGFAHFFEHMMFRGTEKYPARVYDQIVTAMGADANAYTTDDYTCFHLALSTPDLAKVIEIEADRFQNLSYAEADFQTEAGAVYGEYRKGRTEPFEVLDEAIRDTAYDVHTYKHTTIGFEKDIAAMPTMYDYSRSFFKRFYRPDNVVILVTGDFDPAKTLDQIRKAYEDWKPGYVAPDVKPEPEQTRERTVNVAYPGRTLPILTFAWKGMTFDPGSREQAAALLLGDLAFGQTSDVYKDLVLDKRIVQRLTPDFSPNRDPGLWAVYAMVGKEENLDVAKQALAAAVKRYQDAPPDAKRLEDLKKRRRYQMLMGLDTPDHVAGSLAQTVALTGGIEAVDRLYETIDQVTPADIQTLARKYLQDGHRTVAILKGVNS
ncbi:MAG: M16 family metallopeptidase [Candidatus Eisenbacteria bacterium]